MNKNILNFQKNGFIVLRKFLNPIQAKQITVIADNMAKWNDSPGKWLKYYETPECSTTKQLSRLENFINYNSFMENLNKNILIPYLNQICNNKMILFKDKINWKMPGGKGFLAHQDFPAWNGYPNSFYTSIAIPVDPMTIENGCLEMSPYDKHELMDYDEQKMGNLNKQIENNLNWVPIKTSLGDIVIFNSFVPHRSGPNKSKDPRRIFYFTYNYESEGNYYEQYFKDKRTFFPQDCERDKNTKYSLTNNKYNLANPFN